MLLSRTTQLKRLEVKLAGSELLCDVLVKSNLANFVKASERGCMCISTANFNNFPFSSANRFMFFNELVILVRERRKC